MWSGSSDNILQQVPRNYMYNEQVFILDEITTENCAYLIGDLTTFIMNPANYGKKLSFIINSPGGDVSVMMNIIGLINLAKINDMDVVTFVLGSAGSAASLIAVHGTERIISRIARHFVHFGTIFNITTKYSEIKKICDQNEEYAENMKSLYLEACGGKLPLDVLEKLESDERGYLNAQQCIKYGLADYILEETLDVKNNEEHERFEFEKLFKKHKEKEAKELKQKAKEERMAKKKEKAKSKSKKSSKKKEVKNDK